MQRLLLVTSYAISSYSCVDRTWAPFRSPTGETYEMVDEEKGIRLLAEKVRACLRALSGTHVRVISSSHTCKACQARAVLGCLGLYCMLSMLVCA